ncbi:MAG: DUF3054 domain-containing protein [Brachybacterium tyrofermentans]|nr:PROBABLE CONSERVED TRANSMEMBRANE PROTEIN [Corynebacterium xerosis]
MFRSLGALIGDLLVVILFVAIGFLQHGTPLTSQNLFLVGWPFAVGVLLGHLAIRAWRAPFRLWPHGVFVWAITIAAAMAIRTLFSAGTEVAFILTTAIFTGVLMLGWRAVAMYLTRGERRAPLAGAEGAAAEGPATTSPAAESTAPTSTAPESDSAATGSTSATSDGAAAEHSGR